MGRRTRLICTNCGSKNPIQPYCTHCGYPTITATNEERIAWEMRDWQESRAVPRRIATPEPAPSPAASSVVAFEPPLRRGPIEHRPATYGPFRTVGAASGRPTGRYSPAPARDRNAATARAAAAAEAEVIASETRTVDRDENVEREHAADLERAHATIAAAPAPAVASASAAAAPPDLEEAKPAEPVVIDAPTTEPAGSDRARPRRASRGRSGGSAGSPGSTAKRLAAELADIGPDGAQPQPEAVDVSARDEEPAEEHVPVATAPVESPPVEEPPVEEPPVEEPPVEELPVEEPPRAQQEPTATAPPAGDAEEETSEGQVPPRILARTVPLQDALPAAPPPVVPREGDTTGVIRPRSTAGLIQRAVLGTNRPAAPAPQSPAPAASPAPAEPVPPARADEPVPPTPTAEARVSEQPPTNDAAPEQLPKEQSRRRRREKRRARRSEDHTAFWNEPDERDEPSAQAMEPPSAQAMEPPRAEPEPPRAQQEPTAPADAATVPLASWSALETLRGVGAFDMVATLREESARGERTPQTRKERRRERRAARRPDGRRIGRREALERFQVRMLDLRDGERVTMRVEGWSRLRRATLYVTTYRVVLIWRSLGLRARWIPLEEVTVLGSAWRGTDTIVVEGSVEALSFQPGRKELPDLLEHLEHAVAEARIPGSGRHHGAITQEWMDRANDVWDSEVGRVGLFIRRHPLISFAITSVILVMTYIAGRGA